MGSPFGDTDEFLAPSMDATGRYLLFRSMADGRVAGDADGTWDLFRKDLAAGRVDWVSAGVEGLATSGDISADGRFVAFYADRTYVRDMVAGVTAVVDDRAPNGISPPAVSDDGTVVAFVATDFVHVANRASGSVATVGRGVQVNLTPDGRTVVFGEDDGTTFRLVRVDLASGDRMTIHSVPAGPGSSIVMPYVDADASVIAFTVFSNGFAGAQALVWESGVAVPVGTSPLSAAGQLSEDGTRVLVVNVASHEAASGDLVLLDRTRNTTTPVARVEAAWNSSLTRSGRVAAWTTTEGLVAADDNGSPDVYVRRLKTSELKGS